MYQLDIAQHMAKCSVFSSRRWLPLGSPRAVVCVVHFPVSSLAPLPSWWQICFFYPHLAVPVATTDVAIAGRRNLLQVLHLLDRDLLCAYLLPITFRDERYIGRRPSVNSNVLLWHCNWQHDSKSLARLATRWHHTPVRSAVRCYIVEMLPRSEALWAGGMLQHSH